MPFFNNSAWSHTAGKVWVWIVLTVPSTVLCFWFYYTRIRKESRGRKLADGEMQDTETNRFVVGNVL